MIHAYKMNGYNIILDQNSGCVHSVDGVAYDIITMYKEKSKEEIRNFILDKYKNQEDVTSEEIDLKHLLKTEGSFPKILLKLRLRNLKSARVLLKQYVCM